MDSHSPAKVADLGRPLARGNTAEIYAWGNHQVLKLFYPQFSKNVQHEAAVARKVHATGLRVPAVGEVLETAGRLGIVYERIEGVSLLRTLQAQPWQIINIMGLQADLHADMHTRPAEALPAQRQRMVRAIEAAAPVPDPLREHALRVLHALPDGDRLCHGDFHPDNVLMTAQGPVIIDWNDATCGHPLADVARSFLLIHLSGLPPASPARWAQQMLRNSMNFIYLRRYRQLRKVDSEQLNRWLIPVTAARLAENVREEEPYLLAYLRSLCENR